MDAEQARVIVFRAHPIRCWQSDICNLQGKLVFRADMELLDGPSSNSETPLLAVSDPKEGNADIDLSRIYNAPNPGCELQYPLLRVSRDFLALVTAQD